MHPDSEHPSLSDKSSLESFAPPAETTKSADEPVAPFETAHTIAAPTGQSRETASRAAGNQQASPSFALINLIGRGGNGEVWEAEQVSLGRRVAVKRLRHRKDGPSPRASHWVRRFYFRREAILSARLEHPNIVPIHDFGRDENGDPMMAMKLVNGQLWSDLLSEDIRRMPEAEFLAKHLPILVDMAQAVVFAHSRGVIHRDLKPGQVMVGEFGEVLLMDWGLALCLDDPGNPESASEAKRLGLPTLESASGPSGTPALMAPEQTRDDPSGLGFHTDTYLLGGCLYYLLTGCYPHEGDTAREAFANASKGLVPDPRVRAPGRAMSSDLIDLCVQALMPQPADRPSGSALFLKALKEHLSGARLREQSRAQAAFAERILEESPQPGYAQLAEASSAIARASQLWPGNPSLEALGAECGARYAEEALRRKDLGLAEMQAKALPPGPAREDLLRRLDERRAIDRRQRRQRRGATAIAAILMATTLFGGGVALHLIRSESRQATRYAEIAMSNLDEALRQSAAAQERALKTQELISSLLGDMAGLMDRGRPEVDQLATVLTERIHSAVRTFDVSTDPPDLQLQHADFLEEVGNALARARRLEDSYAVLLRVRSLRDRHLEPGDPARARAVANLAVLLDRLGRFEEGEELHREALGMLEASLGATHESTLRARLNLLERQRLPGIGRPMDAGLVGQLLDDLRRLPHPDPELLAQAYRLEISRLLTEGSLDEHPLTVEQALSAAEQASSRNPAILEGLLASLAAAALNEGDAQRALPLAERATELALRHRGSRHPNTASAALAAATAHLLLGNPERAISYTQLAEEADGPDGDPVEENWRLTRLLRADALAALGETAEAALERDRLLAAVAARPDAPPVLVAELAIGTATAWLEAGMPDRAAASIRLAEDRIPSLAPEDAAPLVIRSFVLAAASGGESEAASLRSGFGHRLAGLLGPDCTPSAPVFASLAHGAAYANQMGLLEQLALAMHDVFVAPPPDGIDAEDWRAVQGTAAGAARSFLRRIPPSTPEAAAVRGLLDALSEAVEAGREAGVDTREGMLL